MVNHPIKRLKSYLFLKAETVCKVIFTILLLTSAIIASPDIAAISELQHELIKPEELFIGTPFTLKVTLETNFQNDIYHPVRDTIGVFAILNIQEERAETSDRDKSSALQDLAKKRRVFRYQLAGFETGEQRIPPLHFEIYDPETQKTDRVSTPSLPVNIVSVLTDTTDTIKDIAPPVRIRLKFWDYAIPLLIIAIIVLLIIILIRKMKKPLIEQIPDIEADIRPAYIKALELLKRLKEKKLLEKGENIEYHYQLSLILRIFLEMQYNFKAVEMTTGEIREYFSTNTGYDSDKVKEIFELLNYTDLVKFAKYVPNVNRSLDYLEWTERYFRSFASLSNNPIGSNPSPSGKENTDTNKD